MGLLLALRVALAAPFGPPVAAWQAVTPTVSAPMHVLAATTGTLTSPRGDLVWRIQHGAVFGERRAAREPAPLGFVLGRRGTLSLLDASGTPIAELAPGEAIPLPQDAGGAFASGTGDLALYLQITLIPASALPPEALPDVSVSPAFASATAGPIVLELVRGFVNPGQAATVPEAAEPPLLLALDTPVRVEDAGGAGVLLTRDELMLLDGAATIHNDDPHPASFVAARIMAPSAASGAAASPRASPQTTQPLDPAVADAWRRSGCHLNPANAACATVGDAAACAIDPADAACATDGDGDGCADVAEIRAAFDPFDPADCIGGEGGAPALNCLFPTENIACNGGRIAGSEFACAAARDISLRRVPASFAGCTNEDPPPTDACQIEARDPFCDGFAPGRG